MDNFLMTYIIPIAGAGVLFGVYYFLFKKKPMPLKQEITEVSTQAKEGEEEKDKKEEEVFEAVEARIYDNYTRSIYNSIIQGGTVKEIRKLFGNLGRKWFKDGQWLYALNKSEEGLYSPVVVPATMKEPPSKLHRALVQHAIGIMYDVKEERGLLQKYMPILIWTGVMIFIMFMVATQ